MCDYQCKMYFAKYIQKIYKLCFVFIQEVQVTVLSFFLFSETLNSLIKKALASASCGIICCNIPTCLWEFSLIYTVTSIQFFIKGKINKVKNNHKSGSLYSKETVTNITGYLLIDCLNNSWTDSQGSIFSFPKSFNLCQCFENFMFWTIVLWVTLSKVGCGGVWEVFIKKKCWL